MDRRYCKREVKDIKFKGSFTCHVRHGGFTNQFLKVDNLSRLFIASLNNRDCIATSNTSTFKCYMFCCRILMKYRKVRTVYFCAICSYSDRNRFLTAKDKDRVTLSATPISEHVTNIIFNTEKVNLTDPRYFIYTKTATGKSVFESAAYPGRLLTWDGERVCLKSYNRLDKHCMTEDDRNFEIIRCVRN
ncbi:uncharacterized protein LOC127738237 [Mytilus californianus]|uniref:uncharacterized protein LOC127738237 n=1 Tax=Mytilus californianus TaxID=6549 RepID=UPI002246E264|nr:uncharacterized protein LOC127738237 [Mytilus californianus]